MNEGLAAPNNVHAKIWEKKREEIHKAVPI
jgi:hypothetical protein